MNNKGKTFETWTKNNLEKIGHYVIRLRDVPMINGRRTKATNNPCDFVSLHNGKTYLIECKACKEKRLPISRITQLEELDKAKQQGITCLVAIYFYTQKVRVVVELEAIQQHDMKSIKFDDNICWDFKEYFKELKLC